MLSGLDDEFGQHRNTRNISLLLLCMGAAAYLSGGRLNLLTIGINMAQTSYEKSVSIMPFAYEITKLVALILYRSVGAGDGVWTTAAQSAFQLKQKLDPYDMLSTVSLLVSSLSVAAHVASSTHKYDSVRIGMLKGVLLSFTIIALPAIISGVYRWYKAAIDQNIYTSTVFAVVIIYAVTLAVNVAYDHLKPVIDPEAFSAYLNKGAMLSNELLVDDDDEEEEEEEERVQSE